MSERSRRTAPERRPQAMDARSMAARALKRVIDEGAYSQRAIDSELRASPDRRENRLATALVYGVLTWLPRIDDVLGRYLRNGVRSLPPTAAHRLRIALYEAGWMGERIPESASVNEAVNAVKREWGVKLGGLANGVLRRILREDAVPRPPKDEELVALNGAAVGVAFGLPVWIADALWARLEGTDPDATRQRAIAIARAWTDVSSVHLRRRVERPELPMVPGSESDGGDAPSLRPHPRVPSAWMVDGAFVPQLLDSAEWAIQDAGSQLVALLVPAPSSGPILDVCAGLGVKSRQLLDRFPNALVVRTDRDPRKLRQLDAPGVTAAWELPLPAPEEVRAHGPYDAVVVDAPCSGLGTIGRHPEVKYNRQPHDIAALAELQRRILGAAADQVAPGGTLVYAVCTWTSAEGPEVIEAFLAAHSEFELAPPSGPIDGSALEWEGLVDRSGMVTLMPDVASWDGFFMARMKRRQQAEVTG